MALPALNTQKIDGALGVLPPSSGRPLAIAGPADSGTQNTPAGFARTKDVVATFGGGPLVEAACYALERFGRPVVLVRTAATTAGAAGTIDVTGVTGTSVVSVTSGPAPNDTYDVWVKVITGGTRGTAGITYQVSLDGGVNYGSTQAVGTATAISLSGVGTLGFDLAAGTLLAGDLIKLRTTQPICTSSDVNALATALKNSSLDWEMLLLASPVDATVGGALDTLISGMSAQGRPRMWIGNTRVPTLAESESTYLTAMQAISSAYSTTVGELCAGSCRVPSSLPGRNAIRELPIAYAVAAKEASVDQDVNVAQINAPGGPLLGVQIRDANGNPDRHDEAISPGLDDARFTTLRTWPGYPGVYVTRPRVFSPQGSDFSITPHLRVFNLFWQTLHSYFVARLNKPVRVNKTTGYILESEALEIEKGAEAALRAVLLTKPKASGVTVVVSRTDNLLSTKTMNVDARLVPLAYPETINLSLGFTNPALRAV